MTDEELANLARIPVGILRAIRSVESSGNPSAVRFEPHLFWRNALGLERGTSGPAIKNAITAAQNNQVPYTPCNTSWRTANGLAPCRRDYAASLVPSETDREAFDKARRVNANAAIRATSWGLYQVLGEHLISAFPSTDPVAAFDANPLDASNRMLISWFRSRPAAVTAANARDFVELARLYNGSQPWGVNVARAFAREASEVVRAGGEVVRAGAEEVVRQTKSNFGIVVAIGAFLVWRVLR